MSVEDAINIADLQNMARSRLPRIVFDYLEGGVEDERCLSRNERAFEAVRLVPRYLVDVSTCDVSTELFGKTYAAPFGFAPTGTVGLFRRGGDLMLAEAAAAAGIPYCMSGASNSSLEDAVRLAPDHTWYQLYAARDPRIGDDLSRRSADLGCPALVVTVDVPANPKRDRNARNGFSHKLRLTPRILLDALTHPAWSIEFLRHGGLPTFENWRRYTEQDATPGEVVEFLYGQMPWPGQTWHDIQRYRRLWPRPLILKGILHQDDAIRASELGVDGIIVSNHGGRQLDAAPSPLEVLPSILAAVGKRCTVMLDSGVRRGSDIVKALCLGAQFVFVGRAAAYGVTAGGRAGAARAVSILRDEVGTTLAQIGCPEVAMADPQFLSPNSPVPHSQSGNSGLARS